MFSNLFLIKKPKRPSSISHIDEIRSSEYRVFNAAPYFCGNLYSETAWHKSHLKKLMHHAEHPHTYHIQFTDEEADEHRHRHFQEHVVESIPFHQKILKEHEERLKTISQLVPKSKYDRLCSITLEQGGLPESFVYFPKAREFFFVAEVIGSKKRHWIHLVRDIYKICDVIEVIKK